MFLLDLLCSGNKGSGSSDTCITVSGTGWQEVDGLAAITTSLFWLCALAYLAFTTFCILFLSSDIDRGVRLVGSHYCRRHKPRSALTQIGPQTLAAHNISSEPFYFRSRIPSQLLVDESQWHNYNFDLIYNLFAFVQCTFSGLLNDSNPLVEEYPNQDKLRKISVR